MCSFGDGGNDLEMLREVGDGVAMKNTIPAVLEVNHVTDTNDDEGVLNYIEKNILQNLLDNIRFCQFNIRKAQ